MKMKMKIGGAPENEKDLFRFVSAVVVEMGYGTATKTNLEYETEPTKIFFLLQPYAGPPFLTWVGSWELGTGNWELGSDWRHWEFETAPRLRGEQRHHGRGAGRPVRKRNGNPMGSTNQSMN